MSSRPSYYLDEEFVRDFYVGELAVREVRRVLSVWKHFKEAIERRLDDFDDDEQSWRDYRNAAFDDLPDPLEEPMNYHALSDYVVFVASNDPATADAVFGTVVSAGPDGPELLADDKIVVDNRGGHCLRVDNSGYVTWVCRKFHVMFKRTAE